MNNTLDNIKENLHTLAGYIKQLKQYRDSQWCAFSHYDEEKELIVLSLSKINGILAILQRREDPNVINIIKSYHESLISDVKTLFELRKKESCYPSLYAEESDLLTPIHNLLGSITEDIKKLPRSKTYYFY